MEFIDGAVRLRGNAKAEQFLTTWNPEWLAVFIQWAVNTQCCHFESQIEDRAHFPESGCIVAMSRDIFQFLGPLVGKPPKVFQGNLGCLHMIEFTQMTHIFLVRVRLWMSGGWKQNWKFSCKRQGVGCGESTVFFVFFLQCDIPIYSKTIPIQIWCRLWCYCCLHYVVLCPWCWRMMLQVGFQVYLSIQRVFKNGLKWFGPMVPNEFDEVRAMEPTSDILSVPHVRNEESKCCSFFRKCIFLLQPFFLGILLFQVCWKSIWFCLYGLDGIVCIVLHCVACIALDGFAMFCMSTVWLLISFLPTDAYITCIFYDDLCILRCASGASCHESSRAWGWPATKRSRCFQQLFASWAPKNPRNLQELACGDPFPPKKNVKFQEEPRNWGHSKNIHVSQRGTDEIDVCACVTGCQYPKLYSMVKCSYQFQVLGPVDPRNPEGTSQ